MRVCACTIAAWPMLPSAAVVARSFATQHPDIPFVTLLADTGTPPRAMDLPPFPGELLAVDALDRPDLRHRAFRSEQQPFSYALTAALLEHLLDRGHDAVLFYKQESLVVGPQDAAIAELARHDILLTPHLLAPTPGPDAAERERSILLSGVYNLGFIGVTARPEARRFLRWWDERLDTHCRHAVESGMHYEQRWVDLVPSLFDGVGVLRDPAFNVGHWNITERDVSADAAGEDVRVGDEPCALIRFSGYDPDHADRATRYYDRLRVPDLGPAAAVFERYRRALLDAGWATARTMPYGFATFDDGLPIPELARRVHAALDPEEARRLGDPFVTGPGSFRAWLVAPADDRRPAVSNLLLAVRGSRPDLLAAFPDPLGADRAAFAAWARDSRGDLGIPPELDVAVAPDRGPGVITVATADRLPQVRVLARSLREHHPDLTLHAVIIDGLPAGEDADDGTLRVVPVGDLAIPGIDVQRLAGRWMEVASRVKPAALQSLLAAGHEAALYLDADTEVLGDLTPLLDALREHAIVLLPHVVDPPAGPGIERELVLLKAGTLNGGVVGVRPSAAATRFLDWWAGRTAVAAGSDPENGVNHDQRWLDLAPALFEDAHVLRDPRFDVAYWNLRERADVDWRLMHYSGFDPRDPAVASHYDPALELDERAAAVHRRYAERVLAASAAPAEQDGVARFADGTPVPGVAPEIAASIDPARWRFGDALAAGPGSFVEWLATPVDDARPLIANLWLAVHGLRADLQDAFADPLGADRAAFAHWCRTYGTHEHVVDPAMAPA